MFDPKPIAAFCAANNISCREDQPMKEYTTFRVGGPAALAALPSSAEELALLVGYLRREQIAPVWFVGRGSNLLVADEGLRGIVVLTWGVSDLTVDGSHLIAGAGVSLNALCKAAESASLTGLEFAYGIPGTVGGGVFMNAGAYGGELRDVIEWAEYLDEKGELHRLDKDDLHMIYRGSIFTDHPDWCIVRAGFVLAHGEKEAISEKMADLMSRRRDKQPLEFPSAGSTFKRPVGAFAGALIEQCGLKGFTIGGAAVSEKHAGFVINKRDASASDIEAVIAHVRETVLRETGFALETEVKRLP